MQPGINTIRVAFQSPTEYAHNEYSRHVAEQGYPVLPESLVPEYRGENQAQMIRKMQSSFSWDWGPSYASSGIWKNIWIQGIDGAVIRDVMIFNVANKPVPDETVDTVWTLTARVYFEVVPETESGILSIRRAGSGDAFGIQVQLSASAGPDSYQDISIEVSGADAKLWWPNGYGEPNLYTYEVSYASSNFDETSTRSLRVGFRTVELIQDLVDPSREDWGREFYFKVNGVQVYSKGSNSIPIHVLPERATEEMTRWLMESAKELHTNMIRVWGGGIYESDAFYDIADELGIFIWEDFIFACAMYSATGEYLANVEAEIDTQVKRLQYHTSVVMWAANNENEAALRFNWYGTADGFETYKVDYIKLYVDTIKRQVEALDPSRSCIASSPTNGIQSEVEGWIALDPYDLRYGDIHHYDYKSDSWDWSVFKRARYSSEYGYQSFPYYETLASITENIEEWTWESNSVEHRQHHPKGQVEIRDLIAMHLPLPADYNSTAAFPHMLYMAQVVQSMGMKTQSEFYRRLMDKFDEADGTGHNMGALYWQLNDIWEGCSWASIEITGRWKMLAYYLRRAFAPILPSLYKAENGDAVIELISDSQGHVEGEMLVHIYNLESFAPVYEAPVSISADFLTAKEVFRIPASTLAEVGCGEGASSVCIAKAVPSIGEENFLFLHYPTDKASLKNPMLSIDEVTLLPDGKTITFVLRAEEVALFVFLNLRDRAHGTFEDNGFILVEPTKSLSYVSRDPITLEEFNQQIHIVSLYDVTSVA